jgi:hypothetical protein
LPVQCSSPCSLRSSRWNRARRASRRCGSTACRFFARQIESLPATVVAIDDRSIEALGQWPWPRTILARLIDAIATYQPAAIGVDILMPEVDRLSPEHLLAEVRDSDPALAERLARLPTHDARLAHSVAAAPVVMTMAESLGERHVGGCRWSPSSAGAARGDDMTARLRSRASTACCAASTRSLGGGGHGVISTGSART